MPVAVAVCELHLPSVRGLKEKRKIIKSLVDKIHHRHRVSIGETGHHDLHQLSQLSIAVVASTVSHSEHVLEDVRAMVESRPDVMVSSWHDSVLEDLS
jgi:uncharacterized protein YlxP (DUF503 family)